MSNGQLALHSAADLAALPSGLESFYEDAFQHRFPSVETYNKSEPVLGLLAEAREPLGRRELAAILCCSEAEIATRVSPIRDFLRLRPIFIDQDGCTRKDMLHSFDHISLVQWLSKVDQEELLPLAGRFSINRMSAAERIRSWALAEVEAGSAHNWPYLIRHLRDHLKNEERPKVIAAQLLRIPWLQARLQQDGINSLLADFSDVTPSPELRSLEQTLRQASHILCKKEMNSQLAAQLIARMGATKELYPLRLQLAEWLSRNGPALPCTSSLLKDCLIQGIDVGVLL